MPMFIKENMNIIRKNSFLKIPNDPQIRISAKLENEEIFTNYTL